MSETNKSQGDGNWDDPQLKTERGATKILAVDDNDALRYSLVRSLRDAGYQVIEARSGKEALALSLQSPDLITLDVNLPDIHGFEVCKKIKSNDRTAHIPILHLSSTAIDPDARVQGLSSGADAYLVEPLDRAELIATVGALLRLKNAELLARKHAALAEHARDELARLNETLEKRVRDRTAELKTANESLSDLSSRLLRMQDAERKRIAQDLHDSVGQLLTAIKLNNGLIQHEAPNLPARAVEALAENDSLVDEVLRSIRTISHLLHPPLLEELGLPAALRWYVGEFSQRSGTSVELDCAPFEGRLPSEIETAIFRIVQECLGNVHRHSKSATASVHVRVEKGKAYVEVSDQGEGIAEQHLREITLGTRGGVGLRGMRERVTQFGGELNVKSSTQGTTVVAELPFDPERVATADQRN